jgi:hypothetical protein
LRSAPSKARRFYAALSETCVAWYVSSGVR